MILICKIKKLFDCCGVAIWALHIKLADCKGLQLVSWHDKSRKLNFGYVSWSETSGIGLRIVPCTQNTS